MDHYEQVTEDEGRAYSKLAAIYDALYTGMGKDYARESEILHGLISRYKESTGRQLLDVACGTGGHLAFLRHQYAVEGLDLSGEMVAVARRRLPDIPIYQANMVDFDLGRNFDVVTCLFSAIGYVKTVENLQRAVGSMVRHLQPGGVVIIEPWLRPEVYHPETVHATFVDQPDLKIARMTVSQLTERTAINEMHYLVATPQGVEHFADRHELTLFTDEEYLAAFPVGVVVHHDPDGLTGRGLYIGVKPSRVDSPGG